ncbi:Biuret hydrolase [Halomicronema hongdechloris C2206]|uniref:Biuret hydrolase n=1 Tax=Halomicronema hongdechloris C2206 TaxID=1641165 RepID=A0A1Z3HR69_9CYAN|nr:AtzE family amidohydrolase [Halomicronema hongdechloris]ASC72814.1 Biuret hydrolase [Halomicronema hongdechloris C2206]
MTSTPDALGIANSIRRGERTATEVIAASIAQIEALNPQLNCFTAITADMARAMAADMDRRLSTGEDPGPLAGVPFAVKNLFDIKGLITLAGSRIHRERPPAHQDATLITRLKQAGAILVGALNMDEYAYGFVTVNSHYGITPNPHDVTRIAGGSSGGSAAAIAAGVVPLTLGSDTNGSIRVPAALCGVYGFKPTYGRLSRAGTYPLANSLDHVGPLTRSVRDMAAAYDALQGPDHRDSLCGDRPSEPVSPGLEQGIEGMRIAVAGEYFSQAMEPEVARAVDQVAEALGATKRVVIPESTRARAAAYVITASEGSHLHLSRLQRRPMEFDPATRDRFLAGAMIPASWYIQAQRFRRWYRDRIRLLFQSVDIVLAPTTPCVAPALAQTTLSINGEEMPVRAHLGLYTQPLSFVGLPILSVPVHQPGNLPVGVQVIAAPYQEERVLRVAAHLEAMGITSAPVAAVDGDCPI